MLPDKAVRDRILLWIAVLAACLIQISIAASQITLGLGIVLLLVFRRKWQFPRIWVPLAALFLWTALADVVSPDPWLGRAQIKKFFVFLLIPLVYSVFLTQFEKIYYLIAAWCAAASASALLAIFQFVRHAHESYMAYVGKRITGFESHWMTFGGLQLSVLLLVLAQWFFSNRRMPRWAYSSCVVLSAAILLGGTRSIWLAAGMAALYLVWVWKPKMILAVPVVALIGYFAAPHNVRERILSVTHPQTNIDSNEHREVTFRTGVAMVEAHPWFGLGPEEIARNFESYVPLDIPRPLPPGYYGHLHNIYLQYAAERGIPGLLCVLWFIGLAVFDFGRALPGLRKRGRSQERFILQGAIAVTIGILVGGVFEYNLGDSEVLMMFVSVLALGYAAIDHAGVDSLAGTGLLSPSAQIVSKYGASVSR